MKKNSNLNKTFNFNIGLYVPLVFTFFTSLFLIGDPHLALAIMLISFFCYFWTFFQLFKINFSVTNFFVITFLAIIILSIFIYWSRCNNFMIYFLLALKIVVFLLVISIFLSIYNPKMVYLTKLLFMSLLLFSFFLGIFLCQVKIYFFDALNFFADKNIGNYPLLFNEIPTNVYLSFKNYNFLSAPDNVLFILDFSNDNQLNDFAIQLGRFKETKWLFHYLAQMVLLDSSWIQIHLFLIFV